MVTIEDELRKVFEAHTSGDEPPSDRRASIERRVAQHRRRRLMVGMIGLVVAVAAGATTASTLTGRGVARPTAGSTRPVVVITPHLTAPVRCDGSTAEPVVRALFADLSAGRPIRIATYFNAPRNFDIWWDPTLPSGQVITFQAGPGSNTYTLAGLQSHLNALRGRGITITLTHLQPDGYSNNAFTGSQHPGGVFFFDSSGRARAGAPLVAGGGKGMVDCVTGKLVDFVIDDW
jgi:hypothetical protein